VIKNVHLRFEDPWSQCRYAWGIIIKEVTINGVPGTTPQPPGDLPQNTIFKSKTQKMAFQDIGIYWLNNLERFLTKAPFYEIKDDMRRFLTERDFKKGYPPEFVIVMSGYAYMTKEKTIFEDGKRHINIKLDAHLVPQSVRLERQTVEAFTYLRLFYKRWLQRQKKAKQAAVEKGLAIEAEQERMARFNELFQKIYEYNRTKRAKKHKKFKILHEVKEIIREFKDLLVSVSFKDLSNAVFQALRKPKSHFHFHHQHHHQNQKNIFELSSQEESLADRNYQALFGKKFSFYIDK